MTKLLFLDMDGVLNCEASTERHDAARETIDAYERRRFGISPELAKRLHGIVARTGCRIVFSTSWRYFDDHPIEGPDWRKTLADLAGIDRNLFVGNTPNLSYQRFGDDDFSGRRRGLEIKEWLTRNTDVAVPGSYTFCVLDDITYDIAPVVGEKHVVGTDPATGITDADADRVVAILNGSGK